MAELIRFEVVENPEFWVIGPERKVGGGNENAGAFWGWCFETGALDELETALKPDLFFEALPDTKDTYLGWMGAVDKDGAFDYVIGLPVRPGASVPKGCVCREIPAGKLALGWIQGLESEVCLQEMALMGPAMAKARLTMGDFAIESYVCPRYTTPDETGRVILDLLVSVKQHM